MMRFTHLAPVHGCSLPAPKNNGDEKMELMSLDLKEQKVLWVILNQSQDMGLQRLANLLKSGITGRMVDDWIRQTSDEYDVINKLKSKLCGDLE